MPRELAHLRAVLRYTELLEGFTRNHVDTVVPKYVTAPVFMYIRLIAEEARAGLGLEPDEPATALHPQGVKGLPRDAETGDGEEYRCPVCLGDDLYDAEDETVRCKVDDTRVD